MVGYNLRRARHLRGLTMEQAGEALEPYIGGQWSKSVWSIAETAIGGGRVRRFDADDIAAFALAFDLPIAWFFMPPDPEDVDEGTVIATADADEPRASRDTDVDLADAFAIAFGRGAASDLWAELDRRTAGLPKRARTRARTVAEDAVWEWAVRQAPDEVERLRDLLPHVREVANVIEAVVNQATAAAGDALIEHDDNEEDG